MTDPADTIRRALSEFVPTDRYYGPAGAAGALDRLETQLAAALLVVRKASAYRMIETGELTRALGIGDPLPTEIAAARAALDDALTAYVATPRRE